MSLFRVDSHRTFQGPHQDQPVLKQGTSVSGAKAAVVMIHGRGATAQGMLRLADEWGHRDTVHYLAPQAYHNRWYPYSFLAETKKNQPGLSSGLQLIHDLIQQLSDAGIPKDKIVLLGFSQGACLALEYAARHPQKLGGIVGLSGGLIGSQVSEKNYNGDLYRTPVFLGCSDRDPHVPQQRIEDTARVMKRLNGEVTKKIYPHMGHTVNEDEISFVDALLTEISSKS